MSTSASEFLSLLAGVKLPDDARQNRSTATALSDALAALGSDAVTSAIDTDTTLAANSDLKIASQKATKAYADNLVQGLKWKQSVKVATTANGTLATAYANAQTVDGVTLVTGDRILLKDQSTGSQNGIYTVAATGAPTRATDSDTGAELVSAAVFVEQGTVNADTQWTCSNNSITLGTTAVVFAQVSGAGTYAAGTGIVLTGNSFAADFGTASGKVAAGDKAGASKFDHYADVSTTSTDGTFDPLYSDTLAAGVLTANGDKVFASYGGTIAQHATATRNFKIVFGGTTIFDSGALTVNVASAAWSLEVVIVRVSSSVVRCKTVLNLDAVAALTAPVAHTEVTGLTLTNTQALAVTAAAAGTGAASADIVAKLGCVRWQGAA